MGVPMAPGDVESHLAFFPLRWQVALVVGLGKRGPEAGFFRPIAEAAAPAVPLHFFGISNPPALPPDGRPPSFRPRTTYEVRPRPAVHPPPPPPRPQRLPRAVPP